MLLSVILATALDSNQVLKSSHLKFHNVTDAMESRVEKLRRKAILCVVKRETST